MINADVCLDPDARSNYGIFAQHVMDEHINARLVCVPHPFSPHTCGRPGGGPACQAASCPPWLRRVVQIEHHDELRAVQLL